MTYWLRKCVMWCAPRGDSFHQVWTWYDHPFLAIALLLLICYVTLWPWPFDFGQWSYMAGHVVNPSTKCEDPTTIRSWVMSSDISHRIPLTGESRSLGGKISGGRGRPPANILIPLERQLNALQLCRCHFLYNETLSRLFVLYCRSRPKDDKSRHFDPNFEEVRGGVEPW